MPRTKQPAAERYAQTLKKAMKKGLVVKNGFNYEKTVKAQKSTYHKPSAAYRAMFGDKRK